MACSPSRIYQARQRLYLAAPTHTTLTHLHSAALGEVVQQCCRHHLPQGAQRAQHRSMHHQHIVVTKERVCSQSIPPLCRSPSRGRRSCRLGQAARRTLCASAHMRVTPPSLSSATLSSYTASASPVGRSRQASRTGARRTRASAGAAPSPRARDARPSSRPPPDTPGRALRAARVHSELRQRASADTALAHNRQLAHAPTVSASRATAVASSSSPSFMLKWLLHTETKSVG